MQPDLQIVDLAEARKASTSSQVKLATADGLGRVKSMRASVPVSKTAEFFSLPAVFLWATHRVTRKKNRHKEKQYYYVPDVPVLDREKAHTHTGNSH